MRNNNNGSTLQTIGVLYIIFVIVFMIGGWPFYLAYTLGKGGYATGREVYDQNVFGGLLSGFGGVLLGIGAGMGIECGLVDAVCWLLSKPYIFPIHSTVPNIAGVLFLVGIVVLYRDAALDRLRLMITKKY